MDRDIKKNNVVLINKQQIACSDIDQLIQQNILHANVKDTFQYVYSVWPSYNDTVIRLSHYMLDIIPSDSERNLLIQCLKNAKKEVLTVINENPKSRFIELIKDAFVEGLLLFTTELLRYEVGIIQGDKKIIWEASQETLYEFWLKHNDKPCVLQTFNKTRSFDKTYSRNLIATRIFDQKTIRHLKPSINLLSIKED